MSTMTGKPIIPLSARPTREELRDARAALKALSPFDPNAAAQLKAVDGMIRLMYPRRPKGMDPRKPTEHGRRTGWRRDMVVIAEDCMDQCPRCRKLRSPEPSGRLAGWTATAEQPGTLTLAFTDPADGEKVVYGSRPIMRTARRIRSDEHGRCKFCGTALEIHGKPEIDEPLDWRAPDAGRIRGYRRPRGDLAQPTGVSNPGNEPSTHHRGYSCGALLGEPRREERKVAFQYRRKREDGLVPAGSTAEDVSAELEARAQNILPQFRIVVEDDGTLTRKPLIWNRKKRGSRRDKCITIKGEGVRGHGASKADRRVRRYQAELDRSLRACWMRPDQRRKAIEDSIKALQQVGADTSVFDAMLAELVEIAPVAVEYEDPILVEARRRGDLPPDDVPSLDRAEVNAWDAVRAEEALYAPGSGANRMFAPPKPVGTMR